ncbi:MAG: tail fiber protein [Candidatus Wallbacteria bacterium]|nr:tail fiber protein [Candidatus Wallbacteria bacterium]
MAEPFIGEIRIFPYTYAPYGWLLCDGTIYQAAQFQALFTIIGRTFGGDGRTTFAVPNFKPGGVNSVPMGAGHGPGLTSRQLGQAGGSNQVPIAVTQMPTHTHQVSAASVDGELSTPAGNFLSSEPGNFIYNPVNAPDSAVELDPGALLPTTGGSLPHENRQPLLTLGFYIAAEGIWPERP